MDTGKNELPPEFLQWLNELCEEDSWSGYLKPSINLFTYLEIEEHLKDLSSVYKNSDILRRKNDENTI